MAASITLTAGDLSLRLGFRGGVILDFRLRDQPLLRPATEGATPVESGCFPLLPLGNRIRDNRFSFEGTAYVVPPNAPPDSLHLHGAGWQADWTLTEADTAFARLSHRYLGPDLPHRYSADQCFSLTPQGLQLELVVTNRGEKTLPFGLGWHPFFAAGALLTAPARQVWSEGPDHLPQASQAPPQDLDFARPQALPARYINNAFDGWGGRAQLDWPGYGLTLTADPIFSFYQLYQPADGAFFAFEPMSHLPGGLSLPALGGLKPLAPGESLAGRMTLSPFPSPSVGDPS